MQPHRRERTCFTRVGASASAAVPEPVKKLYHQANELVAPTCKKIKEAAIYYFLPSLSGSIKAAVKPWSKPQDLKSKDILNKHEIKRLTGLIKHSQKKYNVLHPIQKKEKEKIKENIRKFEKQLELALEQDSHLRALWKSELIGRLAGYAGTLAAATVEVPIFALLGLSLSKELGPEAIRAFIPNPTAFIITHSVQAAAINLHFKGAHLAPNEEIKKVSITKARKRIFFTIVSTINAMALNYAFLLLREAYLSPSVSGQLTTHATNITGLNA